MTAFNGDKFGERLFQRVDGYIKAKTASLEKKIAALETKLASAMNFKGVFQRAQRYEKNDVVTHDGALWFCLRSVEGGDGKPGNKSVSAAWLLMTKTR